MINWPETILTRSRIVGILLAAGTSSRFGGPLPKQLLDIDGEPLVRRTARTLIASRLDEVRVVIGHRATEVRAALDDLPITVIKNPEFADGQSTSIRAGLPLLNGRFDGALFCPCDQPRLTPELINRLLDRFAASKAGIIRPVFNSRPGAPVLWARRHFEALRALRGDTGGRILLGQLADEVESVELDRKEPLLDIDTLDDWREFRR